MKVFLIFFIICWLGTITVFGVKVPQGILQNHITGGFKGRFLFDLSLSA